MKEGTAAHKGDYDRPGSCARSLSMDLHNPWADHDLQENQRKIQY